MNSNYTAWTSEAAVLSFLSILAGPETSTLLSVSVPVKGGYLREYCVLVVFFPVKKKWGLGAL